MTLGAAASLGSPSPVQAAAADTPDVPVAVAPEEGAFVETDPVVLAWTAVDAPGGYEVAWATDTGEDAGTATTTAATTTVALAGGSYTWRVRVLPDGDWSLPATFHLDLELTTLPLPAEPQPAAAPATPRPGLEGVPGGVWIIGALGFSVVFLVVVVVQSRVRREQDA